MSEPGPVYVGVLFAVQFEGEDPIDVEEAALGVDPRRGIVQAPTRADLMARRYSAPAGDGPDPVARIWYRRSRRSHPGGDLWWHDLDSATGFAQNMIDGAPRVVVVGPDVHRCDQPGDFLCG